MSLFDLPSDLILVEIFPKLDLFAAVAFTSISRVPFFFRKKQLKELFSYHGRYQLCNQLHSCALARDIRLINWLLRQRYTSTSRPLGEVVPESFWRMICNGFAEVGAVKERLWVVEMNSKFDLQNLSLERLGVECCLAAQNSQLAYLTFLFRGVVSSLEEYRREKIRDYIWRSAVLSNDLNVVKWLEEEKFAPFDVIQLIGLAIEKCSREMVLYLIHSSPNYSIPDSLHPALLNVYAANTDNLDTVLWIKSLGVPLVPEQFLPSIILNYRDALLSWYLSNNPEFDRDFVVRLALQGKRYDLVVKMIHDFGFHLHETLYENVDREKLLWLIEQKCPCDYDTVRVQIVRLVRDGLDSRLLDQWSKFDPHFKEKMADLACRCERWNLLEILVRDFDCELCEDSISYILQVNKPKLLRKLYRYRPFHFHSSHLNTAILRFQWSTFDWLLSLGCPPDEKSFACIIRSGNLKRLRWAQKENWPFPTFAECKQALAEYRQDYSEYFEMRREWQVTSTFLCRSPKIDIRYAPDDIRNFIRRFYPSDLTI